MSQFSRRSILKGSFACVLSKPFKIFSTSSITLFATNSYVYSNTDRLKILLKLQNAISSLGTFFSWISWADGAIPLMARNLPAPTPPNDVCNDSLAASLETYIEEINKIEPAYDLPDVSYDNLSETDLRNNRRIINENLTKILLVHEGDYELDAALLQIDLHRIRLKRRWKALASFSEDLVKLLSVLPTTSSYYKALGCYGAIEITYKDAFLKALDALAQLKTRTAKAQVDYKNDMKRLIGEHQVFLSLENISHQEERRFQNDLNQGLITVREKIRDQRHYVSEQKQTLEETSALLTGSQFDIRSYQDQIVDLEGSRRSLQASIRSDQNLLQQVYSYCPNGNIYSECNHNNEKSRWNRERSQASNRINQNITTINGIGQQISFSNSKIVQLRQAVNDLQRKIVSLERDISENETKIQDFIVSEEEFMREIAQRRFQNPIDSFADYVASEQRQIDRLRNDLD